MRADLGQGQRMHVAVLANLELSQVKAEGLRLPDEMLQLAVSLARRACTRQRDLNAAQVRDELVCGCVPAVGGAPPGRPKSIRDVQEKLPVLLGRRAFLQLSPAFGIRCTQRSQPAAKVCTRRGGGGICCQRPADARCRGL